MSTKTIELAGEWTIERVAEQKRILAKAKPTKSKEGKMPALVIDFAKVTSIDAGGLQLLALWLRHLRSSGATVSVAEVTPDLQNFITLLGYDREILYP